MNRAAPELLTTARLRLRRPRPEDAAAILAAFAGDPEVTRLLAWPRHRSLDDTAAFVRWSDEMWAGAPAGPYLIADEAGGVLGTTGLDVETPWRASTGYVLARSAWGRGFATEVAVAMGALADDLGLVRLAALCHPENVSSARVLAKAGFAKEGVLRRHTVFPNAGFGGPQDVECWARVR
jgi:RimJ/RimL family protein N-acetyltransferase